MRIVDLRSSLAPIVADRRAPAVPIRRPKHDGRPAIDRVKITRALGPGLLYTNRLPEIQPLDWLFPHMSTRPDKILELFDNPSPERDYTIRIRVPEFTCLCPKTGQPDFAELLIEYVPERQCVELKSLKLYVWSFRDEGKFHEAVTNEILGDLVAPLKPRFMRITMDFNVRGGIFTQVVAEHRAPGWAPPPPLQLA